MFRRFCIATGFLAAVLAASAAQAEVVVGKVVEVTDGATLTVLSKSGASLHRVRLAGISAPSAQSVLGSRAREGLRRIIRGRIVRINANALDSAGMMIGTIEIIRSEEDCPVPANCRLPIDPGVSQLTAGYAVVDEQTIQLRSEERQQRYAAAQAEAKTHKRGVWKAHRPVARANTDYEENAGVYPLRAPEPLTGRR
jgi:endonuclease YncB( thermonuclease family)